jgi:hypothetical protein
VVLISPERQEQRKLQAPPKLRPTAPEPRQPSAKISA